MKKILLVLIIIVTYLSTVTAEHKVDSLNGVIAYSVTYSNNTNKLFRINIDGSNNVQIGNIPGRPLSPSYSKDASKIIYYNHLSSQNWQISIMDSNGANSYPLLPNTNSMDWCPSLSPDGKKILFSRSVSTPIWISEIWVVNYNGSNAHKLVDVNGQGAVWSPNGTEILFFDYVEGGGDIWKMDSNGTNIRKIIDHSAEDWWPDWSPDGRKIAFQSKRDGNFEIYTMDIETGELNRLTNNESDDEEPRWSPDGSKIAFSSLRDGHYEIYTMNSDGSNQVRLTSVNGNAINPNWKPAFDLPYFGQIPPQNLPKLFFPDSLLATTNWQYHGSPTFTPDGKEMYFPKYIYSSQKTEIWFSDCLSGKWSEPKIAPFSNNNYQNNNPYFLRNKDTLYFISQRSNGFIFKVTRSNGVWSSPIKINLPIPAGYYYGLQFSIANNGNIYSELTNIQSGSEDLFIWRKVNGSYLQPEKLTTLCSDQLDFTPYVDPEERFILFSSRRPGGYSNTDLYISKRLLNNEWSEPINMGYDINLNSAISPIITNDGKYLFFLAFNPTALGANPYWIDARIINNFLTNIEIGKVINKDFYLYQNYPNPFNPNTTIGYQIPSAGKVSLKVYDILGKEVAVLVDEYKESGRYTVNFTGVNLASGVYLSKLEACNLVSSKKLVLMK